MINMLNFPLSLFLSIALVPLLMRYANVLGLVDRPDGVRKIHTHTIPKSGGLAIAIAVLIPVLYSSGKLTELVPLLIGSLVIVISGLLDDRYDLNFKWKFIGQIIAIVIFLVGTPSLSEKTFFNDAFPAWITTAILFIFLLGVSNAINLSDGLDGLAAGITMISLGLIALLASNAELANVFIVSMALMGALMGFLRYNTHPAQVFMGDTGSQFIGYTSAALAVYLSQNLVSAVSPVLPIMILGLPIMDTLMVMSVRMYAGKSPFYPDKNHIHHQLMKFGFRHYEAVAILYVVQIMLVITTYFLRYQHEITLLIFYILFASLCLSCLYIANLKQWKFRFEREELVFVERRNPFLRSMSWIFEYSVGIITGCFCLALAVLSFSTLESHLVIMRLALALLLGSFLIGIIFPRFSTLTTRLLSYSATVLLLYAFSVSVTTGITGSVLNVILFFLGVLLLLSIRLTRKDQFQLNNQDLIILFILLVGPLLPFEGEDGVKIGVMLFRMSILIYAIEYVISKSQRCNFIIKCFSTLTLFSVCFT
jgi:UDP-GlcNAc:undecaprenyl-phosphate/decaprenyl-phosphate GlcNAc-1-phosphate transferase